jgi:hypothetical protein
MKQYFRYASPALVAAGALIAALALADDKTSSTKLDPKMEEMMKKAEELSTPGPAPQGTRTARRRLECRGQILDGAGCAAHGYKGTAKSTWRLKDRYVQAEFTGEIHGKSISGAQPYRLRQCPTEVPHRLD